ncbi:MAG: 4-hydroxy-2-oxovalerate aldolase [Mycobacterium sp.]|jgi:4-hydroxy 2-oxovalerate aldolase|nr:4-hydroxy-2-oxovalerate aldolase [Mycobacterium sp.]
MTEFQYVDSTLRDGSHAVDHQITPEFCRDVVAGLVGAGVRNIEVGHGAGLGGSSLLQGFARTENVDLFDAAASVLGDATLFTLLIPGIGVMDELREAVDHGVSGVRVATHVTEADVCLQHIELGRKLGIKTMGFLMMTHMAPPEVVAEQARMMAEAGAEAVYLADSAGHMLESEVADRIAAVRAAVSCDIGIHAHNNLGLAVADSLSAMRAGATYIDGTLAGLGAGAGNNQGDVFATVARRMGIDLGIDEFALMDVAEDVVRPQMTSPQVIDRASLTLGYAGIYSSFLHKAIEVGTRYGVEPRDLLLEAGRRGAVGGQEDMLEELALEFVERAPAGAAR